MLNFYHRSTTCREGPHWLDGWKGTWSQSCWRFKLMISWWNRGQRSTEEWNIFWRRLTTGWRSKYYSDDQHQTNNVFYFIIGWRKWRMRNQPPWRWTRVFYLVLSDNESRSFRNINLHVTSFPNKFQIPDIEHYPSTVIEKNGKFSSSEFLIWQMLSANVRDS